MQFRYITFKKSSGRNQNPSRYYNSITNLKFQHKPKLSSFKNPPIKIDLLPRGQNPLSYYILYNELSKDDITTKANNEVERT
jgi:hypothetical protein